MNKETKQFLEEIKERGWRWSYRRSGHLKLKGPRGETVFCSATPSDSRAWDNVRRDMRRASSRRRM